MKTNFLIYFFLNTDLKLFNIYCYKSYILNKCCAFLKLFINQRILKKASQISNIDNKSELHKMYLKVYKKIEKINAWLDDHKWLLAKI